MATGEEDRTPLLAEQGQVPQVRQRNQGERKKDNWVPPTDAEWNPDLPYGGKVYLPRKKKDDPTWVRVLEAVVLIATVAFALYAYFYFDNVHFHITNGYAHLGYAVAQHQVGQRYLHGVGVDKHPHKAMEWFKKAADQGHPHASYNLAVGHLQGIRTDLLDRGEAHVLIAKAAEKGVQEAHQVLNDVCAKGGCD